MNLYDYMLNASRRFVDDERYNITCLYRYFDEDDILLYVGISNQPSKREEAHWKNDIEWRICATYMTVELFPNRRIAEIAEQRAIVKEEPEFNRKILAAPELDEMPAHKWYFDMCGGNCVGFDPRTLDLCDYETPEGYPGPWWREPTFRENKA